MGPAPKTEGQNQGQCGKHAQVIFFLFFGKRNTATEQNFQTGLSQSTQKSACSTVAQKTRLSITKKKLQEHCSNLKKRRQDFCEMIVRLFVFLSIAFELGISIHKILRSDRTVFWAKMQATVLFHTKQLRDLFFSAKNSIWHQDINLQAIPFNVVHIEGTTKSRQKSVHTFVHHELALNARVYNRHCNKNKFCSC